MADDNENKNPFSRPGFIAAAAVIALVVVLGIVLAVVISNRPDSQSEGSPAESSAALPVTKTADAGGASVCGLSAGSGATSLATAPASKWEYQGTVAYPTSDTFGPGKTTNGVRTCFQRSIEGAVFASANAVVQGSDSSTVKAWLDYFVTGSARDQVLASGAGSSSETGTRVDIAGFRVLAYNDDSARIDVAVRGSSSGKTVTLSMVYELVWQNGDWKLNVTNATSPIDVATITDLTGYISWGA